MWGREKNKLKHCTCLGYNSLSARAMSESPGGPAVVLWAEGIRKWLLFPLPWDTSKISKCVVCIFLFFFLRSLIQFWICGRGRIWCGLATRLSSNVSPPSIFFFYCRLLASSWRIRHARVFNLWWIILSMFSKSLIFLKTGWRTCPQNVSGMAPRFRSTLNSLLFMSEVCGHKFYRPIPPSPHIHQRDSCTAFPGASS